MGSAVEENNKSLSCIQCKKRFSSAKTLNIHKMIHTGEKPFSCSHCDYKCLTSSYLRKHELIHTGDKAFSCTHCDYKCSRLAYLKRHVRNHAGSTDWDFSGSFQDFQDIKTEDNNKMQCWLLQTENSENIAWECAFLPTWVLMKRIPIMG